MDELPLIELTELTGNSEPKLNSFQQALEPYADLIAVFWLLLWVLTAITLLIIIIRNYRNKDRTHS